MEYRSGLVVAASLAIVSLIVASAACSSSSSNNTTTPTGEGGVAVSADLCKQKGNYEDCFDCCDPGDGYLVGQAAFQSCMCQGPCKTPCATSVCMDTSDGGVAGDETDDCSKCLDTDPSAANCAQQAQNTCSLNPDCARFTQCINDACEALPDLDAGH